MAVSFDLFDTLVAVDRPEDTPAAIAAELRERGRPVPEDWTAAGREAAAAIDVPEGREVSIVTYVRFALERRDRSVPEETIEAAVLDAFDRPIEVRVGAREAVEVAGVCGQVGVLSNCTVPGLVERVLERAAIPADRFDAVVASVDCGWHKPHPRAFETIARELGVPLGELLHVGDDPHDDGGADAAGANAVVLEDVPLPAVPAYLEARCR